MQQLAMQVSTRVLGTHVLIKHLFSLSRCLLLCFVSTLVFDKRRQRLVCFDFRYKQIALSSDEWFIIKYHMSVTIHCTLFCAIRAKKALISGDCWLILASQWRSCYWHVIFDFLSCFDFSSFESNSSLVSLCLVHFRRRKGFKLQCFATKTRTQ